MSVAAYDYVIVGAGSAGCVLANRLSADPSARVLLIEAGGRDSNPLIHIPSGIAKLPGNRAVNWDYHTEPEPELRNRRLWWPRGRVLGGSSSINAMCYILGQAEDYDGWEAAGCPGWGFSSVLPYFRKSKFQEHGANGFLHVNDLLYRNPLSETFIEASGQYGLARNKDFNNGTQTGAGYYQVTQRAGRRCSTATGFLKPVKSRSNLELLTRALVSRVRFDGKRATGVEYVRHGKTHLVQANQEVILSGGAINSPQLLMLSGVGPESETRAHGIETVHHLPGVGQNLQDHLDICTLYKCTKNITYDFSLLDEMRVMLRYLLKKDGPATTNAAESGAFLSSSYSNGRPDIQLHFVPALLDDHGRNKINGAGFTIHACNLRPESRGSIGLRSARPGDKPVIRANYLSEPADMRVMVECAKVGRDIIQQPAFDAFRGDEIYPGDDVRTDAGMIDFIRQKAETIYHPVGTCKMGADNDAVVDHELRVRGVDALRVVDASVMPTLVSGNTNAPTIMIAEKAADMIAAS